MHQMLKRDEWSLARRLWSLLFLILASVVVAFGAVAYTEARDATIEARQQSLAGTAREAVGNLGRTISTRLITEERFAQSAPVLQALRATPPTDPERVALHAIVQREQRPGDSIVIARRLLRRDGRIMYAQAALAAGDSLALAATLARVWRTDSAAVSPFFARGARAGIWLAVPVRSQGRTIGALAHEIALLGSANTDRALSRLTGLPSRVYYVNGDFSEWLNGEGFRAAPLFEASAFPDWRTALSARVPVRGVSHMVAVAPVSGTPWAVVMLQREDAVFEHIVQRGRRLALMALILLALGTIGIMLVARRETAPLEVVRAAADAMARGEDPPPIAPHGSSETASLIRSFNAMAAALHESHVTLEARNTALQQANEAKARFLAVMSHELRTPLHAIAGHTELLTLGIHGPVSEAQRQALERVQHNSRQLLHLVTDVLHFARQDALPLPVDIGVVSVNDVFGLLAENVKHEAEQKQLTLCIEPTTCHVLADRHRLLQVIANLVANALRFTPPGGTVHVSAGAEGDRVRVAVRDTGIGIAAEQVTRIFEPFVQLEGGLTRRAGGAGLGLAIVRQLTEAMGGSVSVSSVPGEGSTFEVRFPMAPDMSASRMTMAAATPSREQVGAG